MLRYYFMLIKINLKIKCILILKSISDKLNYDEDKKYLDKDYKEKKIIYPDLFNGEPIITDYN